jgi:hypothetical protein
VATGNDDVPRRIGARVAAGGAKVQDRFGLLLILLIGSFIALGFAESTWAVVLASALQIAALVVASLATRLWRDHHSLGVVALVGIVAVAVSGLSGRPAQIVAATASAIVLIAILVAVLDRVLRHRKVTVQTLYGAVCAYFVLGLIFASVYGGLDAGSTRLFGETVERSVYSYFSFTTLTTLGFGDYTVKTNGGRRIVVLEAVAGQLFLATTVARLVSLYKSTPTEEQPPEGDPAVP